MSKKITLKDRVSTRNVYHGQPFTIIDRQ